MSLNDLPSAERIHISFFGRRNAGKSSLVNAVTGQSLSIVSDTPGTTTDPVTKSMELLPLGPVVIIDTPGFDDEGALGALRVRKARQILNKTDIAVLVSDITKEISESELQLIELFRQKEIPWLLVRNKSDLPAADRIPADSSASLPEQPSFRDSQQVSPQASLAVSALTGENIPRLKELIASCASGIREEKYIVRDLIHAGDLVILVIPIDESAPKGRIILPQQNVLREILDAGAAAVCAQPPALAETLGNLKQKPALVITDSQAFREVSADTPAEIPLTSFSVLLARYKGYLASAAKGAGCIPALSDGDTILMAESCTHHRQCNDIGTVKIPRLLRKITGKDLRFETSSGTEFPEDLSPYAMVIHCGGCMTSDREMRFRIKCAEDQNVPVTNYGTVLAYANGILTRALEPLAGK